MEGVGDKIIFWLRICSWPPFVIHKFLADPSLWTLFYFVTPPPPPFPHPHSLHTIFILIKVRKWTSDKIAFWYNTLYRPDLTGRNHCQSALSNVLFTLCPGIILLFCRMFFTLSKVVKWLTSAFTYFSSTINFCENSDMASLLSAVNFFWSDRYVRIG